MVEAFEVSMECGIPIVVVAETPIALGPLILTADGLLRHQEDALAIGQPIGLQMWTRGRRLRQAFPLAPASAKVAMPMWQAAAALRIGTASAAPEASPNQLRLWLSSMA
jgi:hypothetical protein